MFVRIDNLTIASIGYCDGFYNIKNNSLKTIHIWRNDVLQDSCNLAKNKSYINDKNNYFFNYRDGYDLFFNELEKLHQFISTDSLTIHCHAGKTRSPTVALFALSVLKQTHPLKLLNLLYEEYYKQTKELPNLTMLPLEGIVKYFEAVFKDKKI